MFQFLYNLISTIIYSICIILGAIITGRQPKISLYHLEEGNDSLFSRSTWFDNDSPYRWKSRNEDLKEFNSLKLKAYVTKTLNSYNEFSKLTATEKECAKDIIVGLIYNNNREIL